MSKHANRTAESVYRCAKRLNKLSEHEDLLSESVNRMAERSYGKAKHLNLSLIHI